MKHELDFLRGVAASQDELLSRSTLVERELVRLQEEQVRATSTTVSTRRSSHWVWATLGAAAAVSALALVALRDQPLTFQVASAGEGELGAPLAAPSNEPVAIDFSDGSTLKVAPGGRARVTHVDAAGAVVKLERGYADMAVVPRLGARWRVDAGPFRVHVKGTAFSLDWEPAGQRLDFKLREGKVVIDGGCLPRPRTLIAGESLYTSCAPGNAAPAASMGSAAPEPDVVAAPPVEAPSPALSPESLPELAGAPVRSSDPSVREATPAWRQLAASGKFREALAAAERAGFDAELQRGTSEDLMALGDAARLSGNSARALQSYLASRQRRPMAKQSAFAIGLVHFDQRRAYAEAARWFSTYLQEQPRGPLAEQAAGRLMEAAERAGDHTTARATAQKYLAQHAAGPYVDLARRLSGSE